MVRGGVIFTSNFWPVVMKNRLPTFGHTQVGLGGNKRQTTDQMSAALGFRWTSLGGGAKSPDLDSIMIAT